MRAFGDLATSNSGRIYEWVESGWWQMHYTDEERSILASGEIPREWEPTDAEIESARQYAEGLLGGVAISRRPNNG